MSIVNGRQQAPTVAEIRDDHVARYRFALGALEEGEKAIDLGCGCGYGASILAGKVAKVTAIDADGEAIDYAKAHYAADNIVFRTGRAEGARLPKADAVIAFEVIEHVEDAAAVLARLAKAAPVLIGSVPNEDVVPFATANNPYHIRHFTPAELRDVLKAGGWNHVEIRSQKGKRGAEASVEPGEGGRTLVFVASR